VIEDAAQSFGATYKGRRSCGLSLIGCTSFFPAKPLGAYGDAGACFTNDDGLAKSIREIRNHGQDRRYHHPRLGLNGRLDTIQAAILLAKLALFPREVELRSALGGRYSELLMSRGARSSREGGARVLTPYIHADNTSVYAQYTVQVDERERVIAELGEMGIPTAVHYPVPLNEQPVFSSQAPSGAAPVSTGVASRVLSLPMHPYLTEDLLSEVVDKLASATGLDGQA
jgi:UDP-2-acetamido-2-deoxy-ribo-hexuluronate aminotransferase